jgi:WD40 repeat protein
MAVAALPDGRRALSASADKTLKLWDLETGNPLAAFTADSDPSPSRRTIASLLARTMAGSIFYGT